MVTLRKLVSFQDLSEQQLAELGAIYEEAFLAPWEWSLDEVLALARSSDGRYSALAALEEDAVAGFIIAEYLPVSELWYIHYLAVRSSMRGKGWGAYLLKSSLAEGEAAAHAHRRPGCIGAALEVEIVDGPPPEADREQRRRRYAFYQAHGALATGARYPRPSFAPPEMPEWELLIIPGRAWPGVLDDPLRYRIARGVAVEGYEMSEDEAWVAAELSRFALPPNATGSGDA